MNLAELHRNIGSTHERAGHQIIVGISGYGGSGKSTLARELVEVVPDAIRIRGDDFLDPGRSHQRSSDWNGVERSRLVAEVLEPHRRGTGGKFHRWDWAEGRLGPAEPLPSAQVIVVDLIGLFHPEALGSIDVAIWCDLDLETATARGIRRDNQLGRTHRQLWDIWRQNEVDFEQRFSPRDHADLIYSTA